MSGLTGYLLSNGTDLSNVFMNINTPYVLLNANTVMTGANTFTKSVDLSGSFLYGRNDGYDFTSLQTTPYSIGYTILIDYSISSIIAATTYSTSVASLSVGLWILNGYIRIVQGGSFNYNVSYPWIQVYNTTTGGLPNTYVINQVYPIDKNTVMVAGNNPTLPFSNIFNVIADETITMNIGVNMTVGTSTLKLVGGFTKIA